VLVIGQTRDLTSNGNGTQGYLRAPMMTIITTTIITISARRNYGRSKRRNRTFRKYYSAKRKWSAVSRARCKISPLFFRSAKRKSRRDNLISSERDCTPRGNGFTLQLLNPRPRSCYRPMHGRTEQRDCALFIDNKDRAVPIRGTDSSLRKTC